VVRGRDGEIFRYKALDLRQGFLQQGSCAGWLLSLQQYSLVN